VRPSESVAFTFVFPGSKRSTAFISPLKAASRKLSSVAGVDNPRGVGISEGIGSIVSPCFDSFEFRLSVQAVIIKNKHSNVSMSLVMLKNVYPWINVV
jgi:hypothetical protein